MPFIGNKPTALPLSSNDLEDNIISTAKIQDNAVTPAKYIEPIPFRNIIINGDMSIAQRGTSFSSISSGSANFGVDRFNVEVSSLGTWTISQETDVPTGQGFSKSLKLDCTTADASPSADDLIVLTQSIEGQNLQYLKKGTSNAESITLSFWVKSNKTGTYIAELRDKDNNRTINKSYTINSSNTWEKKTITYDGDTTGTLDNDNGNSFQLNFWLGGGSNWTSGTLQTSWGSNTQANRQVGQVNLGDSTANEWYITGVQLEAGTSASDFEFLPHDVNLQRCLRYFELETVPYDALICISQALGSTSSVGFKQYKVQKRSAPSISISGNYFAFGSNSANAGGSASFNPRGVDVYRLDINSASGLTAGNASAVYSSTGGVTLSYNSEL